MAAAVEPAEDRHLENEADGEGHGEREREASPEASGPRTEHGDEIGADHVLDAVGEVDEIHHPEHERQTCGDQEKQDAELQTVQGLDDEKRARHLWYRPRRASSAGTPWRRRRRSP